MRLMRTSAKGEFDDSLQTSVVNQERRTESRKDSDAGPRSTDAGGPYHIERSYC